MGVLEAMFEALAREADREWLTIDSTIVRAHQQAAGARRKKGPHAQGLGRCLELEPTPQFGVLMLALLPLRMRPR
jgi:hypothetical protein